MADNDRLFNKLQLKSRLRQQAAECQAVEEEEHDSRALTRADERRARERTDRRRREGAAALERGRLESIEHRHRAAIRDRAVATLVPIVETMEDRQRITLHAARRDELAKLLQRERRRRLVVESADVKFGVINACKALWASQHREHRETTLCDEAHARGSIEAHEARCQRLIADLVHRRRQDMEVRAEERERAALQGKEARALRELTMGQQRARRVVESETRARIAAEKEETARRWKQGLRSIHHGEQEARKQLAADERERLADIAREWDGAARWLYDLFDLYTVERDFCSLAAAACAACLDGLEDAGRYMVVAGEKERWEDILHEFSTDLPCNSDGTREDDGNISPSLEPSAPPPPQPPFNRGAEADPHLPRSATSFAWVPGHASFVDTFRALGDNVNPDDNNDDDDEDGAAPPPADDQPRRNPLLHEHEGRVYRWSGTGSKRRERQGEWNVCTLNVRRKSDCADLADCMLHHNIDFMALTEVQSRRAIDRTVDGTRFFLPDTGTGVGVGFAIRVAPPASPGEPQVDPGPQPLGVAFRAANRIAVFSTRHGRTAVSFIAAYAPTASAPAAARADFWQALQETMSEQTGTYVLLGDFNAQLPNRVRTCDANRNGRHMEALMEEAGMIVANWATEKKKKRRVWTWRRPRIGNRVPRGLRVLDLMLLPTAHTDALRDVRAVFPSLDGCDHRMVRARFKPRFRRIAPAGPGADDPLPPAAPDDDDVEVPAQPTVEVLNMILTEQCKVRHPPSRPQTYSKPWMNDDVRHKTRAKNKAYEVLREARRHATSNTRSLKAATDAHNRARKEARRARTAAHTAYWKNWAEEVSDYIDSGQISRAYDKLRPRYKPKVTARPADQKMVKQCFAHFHTLLDPPPSQLMRGDDTLAAHPAPERFDHPHPDGELFVRIAGTRPAVIRDDDPDGLLQRAENANDQGWAYTVRSVSNATQLDQALDEAATPPTATGVAFKYGGAPRSRVPRSILCGLLHVLNHHHETRVTVDCFEPYKLGIALAAMSVGREVNFGGVDNGDIWREILRHIVVHGRIINVTGGFYAHCDVEFPDRDRIAASRPGLHNLLRHADNARNSAARAPPEPLDDAAVPWTGVSAAEPTRHEVLFALSQLRHSAPGEDGVKVADVVGDDVLRDLLVQLVRKCWETNEVPSAFQRAIIVALPKKPGATAWTDHRGITLLAVGGKTLARVIFNRARSAPVSDTQNGFRQYYSTTDAVFTLTNLKADARRCGLPLVCTYIDLTKAYDTIDREFIWRTARRQGLDGTALRLIQAMYDDSISVRVGSTVSDDRFKSAQGARQGCLLSPMLFNWVFDRVLMEAAKSLHGIPTYTPETPPGVSPGPPLPGQRDHEWTPQQLAYADDVCLLSPNMACAQHDFDVFAAACRRAGMTISVKKTEYQQMPERRTDLRPDVNRATAEQLLDVQTYGVTQYIVVSNEPLVPPATRPSWQCPVCQHDCVGGGGTLDKMYDNMRTKIEAHLQDRHWIAISIASEQPLEVNDKDFCKKVTGGDRSAPPQYECRWRASPHGPFCEHVRGDRQGVLNHAESAGHRGPRLRVGATYLIPKHSEKHDALARLEALNLAPLDNPPADIRWGPGADEVLPRCTDFRYLGRISTADGRDTAAISARLALAGKSAKELLVGPLRHAPMHVRLSVWNSVVKAQLLYAGETWYISVADRRRIARFETRWLRRVAGMMPKWRRGRVDYPRNRDVRARLGVAPLVDQLDRARLRYLGHVLRKPVTSNVRKSLMNRVYLPGRPGVNQCDSLRAQLWTLMDDAGLSIGDAANKTKWRGACDKWLAGRIALDASDVSPPGGGGPPGDHPAG